MRINFYVEASVYLGGGSLNDRSFEEHFGATPDVASSMWEWLVVHDMIPDKARPCHLLWLFYWWKSNALQDVCAKFLHCDKNTFQIWRDLMEIAVSNLPVVSNKGYTLPGENCRLTIVTD
jgi:hypothetical protein